MLHYLAKNGSQGAWPDRIVIGYGKVMLPASAGGKTAMRANLPGEFIPKGTSECFFQFAGREIARDLHTVAISSSHAVKTDDRWCLTFFKMTQDSLPNIA